MAYSIKLKPTARFFTVLALRDGHKAFVFVWDFFHWLRFSDVPGIMLLGTGKTYAEAEAICAAKAPGRQIVYKYCPKAGQ